jgi:hypothetical protein
LCNGSVYVFYPDEGKVNRLLRLEIPTNEQGGSSCGINVYFVFGISEKGDAALSTFFYSTGTIDQYFGVALYTSVDDVSDFFD